MLGGWISVLRFFLYRHRLLAFAIAQVVQLGSAHISGTFDFDFGDTRRMQRKDTLDAFTVRDSTDRECRIDAGATLADHNASKNLNSLLVPFNDSRVNFNSVANLERRDIRL